MRLFPSFAPDSAPLARFLLPFVTFWRRNYCLPLLAHSPRRIRKYVGSQKQAPIRISPNGIFDTPPQPFPAIQYQFSIAIFGLTGTQSPFNHGQKTRQSLFKATQGIGHLTLRELKRLSAGQEVFKPKSLLLAVDRERRFLGI